MLAKSQKAMIWAGVFLSAIYGLGYVLMGFFPPPSPTLGAAEVLKLYATNLTQFRIGVMLMVIGGGFNVLWSTVTAVQMARQEEGTPIWSILQLCGGTLNTLLFFLPPVFWGVAAFSIERDPALTLLMHEVAFIIFLTAVSVFPMQMVPIGVVGLMGSTKPTPPAFPRWMGYFSIWMAITGEAGVAALLFKTGPFAWDGLFPFYLPVFVFGAWAITLIFLLLRDASRQSGLIK